MRPRPQNLDLLGDIDGCDDAYWKSEIAANKADPRRPAPAATGPHSPLIRLSASAEHVAEIAADPLASHRSRRLVAWHPLCPPEFARALLDLTPAADTCDLVHATLVNRYLDWDTLADLYHGHAHDPLPRTTGGTGEFIVRRSCTLTGLAEVLLKNRAASPALVAHAIAVLHGTLDTDPSTRWRYLSDTAVRDALTHPNVSGDRIVEFITGMINVDRIEPSMPYAIESLLDEVESIDGYVFGDAREFTAYGRIGWVDDWQSRRVMNASLA